MPKPAVVHATTHSGIVRSPRAPTMPAMPDRQEGEAGRHDPSGAGGVDPALLDPRGGGPSEGGACERDAGDPGGLVADVLERERHVGVGAEEREGEDAADHDGGGHARREPQRARWHQRDERPHRDRAPRAAAAGRRPTRGGR